MVLTGSRLEAVRYKQSFDEYIKKRGYAIKSLVAFSGTVQDDKVEDKTYTEEQMNDGIREKDLPERFATPDFQVLLVAEKYQTGFDQPLLHTMYVDRRLSGIQAGSNTVPAQSNPPVEGRHIRSRFCKRPRRNSGGIQAILRRRNHGRRS